MNENLVRRIKKQLNMKFYVMNDAWLRDCIEFFISSKAPNDMTDKHILEFVEGQWQLSDLREISNENGCLPKNLAQHVRTVLPSTYILQVDKMYDIGNSKYKQLCQLRKISSENLETMEKEKPFECEPKARRMLQLYLTDGVQNVTAIEYIPLRQLTGTLLPGYKVMIIGPVDCRRGIILLEDGKYREIGGEVESFLKPNALENVLARALGEPENPDPYNDNGSSRDQNVQNTLPDTNTENNFFDDDFELTVDLDAVTAIERCGQEVIDAIHNPSISMNERGQSTQMTKEKMPEERFFLEDFDSGGFELLEDWPNNSSPRSLPTLKTEGFKKKDDTMIIEDGSESTSDSRSKSHPMVSFKNERAVEFPDDDFDFDNCDMIMETESQRQEYRIAQGSSLSDFNSEIGTRSLPGTRKLIPTRDDATTKAKESISLEVSITRSEKPMPMISSAPSISKTAQEILKTETISDLMSSPSKICDVLRDILPEAVTGTIYKTVRGQVKNHSTLTKQGKCWAVTALIVDHTSRLEVCFDSEILERFLGFSVQEFSQKKKLAKTDVRVNNELRLRLRQAQHQIQNLDALLKLRLTQGQMPKVVDITQLTSQQKDLMKGIK